MMGTAGFMQQAGAKRVHKAHLWGMYVRQLARGSGLARLLVDAVLAHAARHAELIQLSVVSDNLGAQRLYAAAGFTPYGVEQRSLKVDGRYLDEVLMVKFLARSV
jgi:RimJ/RimL family protein N-acetyltransferase